MTKVKKLGNSSGNAKETDKQDFFKREEVKDTPFTIIINDEKNEAFGCVGNYRVTKIYASKDFKAIEKEVKKITWNRLIQVMGIMIEERDRLTLKTEKNEQ